MWKMALPTWCGYEQGGGHWEARKWGRVGCRAPKKGNVKSKRVQGKKWGQEPTLLEIKIFVQLICLSPSRP